MITKLIVNFFSFIEESEMVIRSSDVPFLMSHMYRHAYKWRDIGLSLNFQHGELENIATATTEREKLTRLLDQWAQWPTADHPGTATMERLHDALCSGMVGLGAQANDLYELRIYLPSQNETV